MPTEPPPARRGDGRGSEHDGREDPRQRGEEAQAAGAVGICAAKVSEAEALVQAAIAREESRGAHARVDFPDRDDDDFRLRIVVRG